MGHSLPQLLSQILAGECLACCFLLTAIHAVIPDHVAQHHFRVLRKVGIDRDAVRRLSKMHPIRFNIDGPIPLLQENDIAGDIRAGVSPESIIRQTDRAQQFSPLGDVLPHFRGLLVHRAFGGDKGDNTAGPDLV